MKTSVKNPQNSNSNNSIVHVDFWEKMAAYEAAPYTTNAKQLEKLGITQVNIDRLSDEEVHSALWEIIQNLGNMRVFLDRTDHLNDRELYLHLWSHTLQQRVKDVPIDKNAAQYIDLIGGGSDEDFDVLLRYYADDDEVEMWRDSFPEMEFPQREELPYNRDSLMPQCQI